MNDQSKHSAPPATRRRLPATTLPASREDRRGWSLLSLLLHVLVIALLVTPLANHEADIVERAQGAGGPGPAGGGGGGHRGSGGVIERVRFVRMAPPAAPTPQPRSIVPPPKPVVKPSVKPAVKPPPVIPPKVEVTPSTTPEIAKVAEVTAPVAGTGGGTGHDGSSGSGPGSGGGYGSGVGTGRGSGIGPGTGGGTQANYPPSPTELFIPPLPMPNDVRGFHLIAEFDVDSTGKVLDWHFTPTRDGDYNKRLAEVLKGFRFRPGTRPDGTPIRMKAQIIYDF